MTIQSPDELVCEGRIMIEIIVLLKKSAATYPSCSVLKSSTCKLGNPGVNINS